MKFDIVESEHGEEVLAPGPRVPAGTGSPATEPRVPPPVPRIREASEYMRLRARSDSAGARSSLNRMLHTVEAAGAEAAPGPGPAVPDEPDTFRPEAFRARTAP